VTNRPHLLLLLFVGVVVVVFLDPLFLPRVFLRRDMGIFFAPIEDAVHREWSRGEIPIWWEDASGGRPLLPNPNAGAFYPPRILGALLPFPIYFKLFPIAHVALAGVGMFLLLTHWKRSPEASLVGAMAYAFSGPAMSLLFFIDFLPGFALLPIVLWAVSRVSERPTARRGAVFALVFAILLLAGDVFTTSLAVVGTTLYLLLDAPRPAHRAILWTSVATGAGLVAAAIQAVPTLLYVPLSDRAFGQLRIFEAFTWTLNPARLLEWVVPYAFGDTQKLSYIQSWGYWAFGGRPVGYFLTLFAGTVASVGVAREIVRPKTLGLRAPASIRWFLWISLFLACAGLLIPNHLGSKASSPIPLRFPEKFVMGAILSLAIFAAFEWDRREAERATPRGPWIMAGALMTAAVFALVFAGRLGPALVRWSGSSPAAVPSATRRFPVLLALAAVHWSFGALALTLRTRSRSASWQWIALGLVLTDILLATRKIAVSSPSNLIVEEPPAARILDRLDPGARYSFFDWLSTEESVKDAVGRLPEEDRLEFDWSTLNTYYGSLWGRPTILNADADLSDTYRMGAVHRLLEYHFEQEPGLRNRIAPFFGGLSIRYVLHSPGIHLPGSIPGGRSGDVVIEEIPDAVARVRLATRWSEMADPLLLWKRMWKGADRPEVALLETGRVRDGFARPGKIRVRIAEARRFSLDVYAPDPTWLVVTREFWNWRDVTVDGRRVDVVPERFALSAAAIPAGHHRVDWRERLPGGLVGPILSLAGLLAILFGFLQPDRSAGVS
jgi:hypothetical protein